MFGAVKAPVFSAGQKLFEMVRNYKNGKIDPSDSQGGEKKRLLEGRSMEDSDADRANEKGERKEDHAPLVF